MVEREYQGICPEGHRSYLRLRTFEVQQFGRCHTCGQDALLGLLPPVA
jgi:hypothetical protein